MTPRPPPLAGIRSLDSLRLGSLIINTNDINQNIHIPFTNRPSADEIEMAPSTRDYQDTHSLSRGTKILSFLSGLLSLSRRKIKKSTCTITAEECTKRCLSNHSTWFADICSDPSTRKWLEEAIKNNNDVYLVVGLLILKDATLTIDNSSTTDKTCGADTPATAISPLSLVAGAAFGTTASQSRSGVSSAPGENIFSFWYRKVKFTWHFSRDIDKGVLGQTTHWKPFYEVRSATNTAGESEEEDMVGVSLEPVEDWSRTESTKQLQAGGCRDLWNPAGLLCISFLVLFLVIPFPFLLFSWPGVWKETISAP